MQVFKYEIMFATRDDVTPEQAAEFMDRALESLEGDTDYQYSLNLVKVNKGIPVGDINWDSVNDLSWDERNKILKFWNDQAKKEARKAHNANN